MSKLTLLQRFPPLTSRPGSVNTSGRNPSAPAADSLLLWPVSLLPSCHPLKPLVQASQHLVCMLHVTWISEILILLSLPFCYLSLTLALHFSSLLFSSLLITISMLGSWLKQVSKVSSPRLFKKKEHICAIFPMQIVLIVLICDLIQMDWYLSFLKQKWWFQLLKCNYLLILLVIWVLRWPSGAKTLQPPQTFQSGEIHYLKKKLRKYKNTNMPKHLHQLHNTCAALTKALHKRKRWFIQLGPQPLFLMLGNSKVSSLSLSQQTYPKYTFYRLILTMWFHASTDIIPDQLKACWLT